MAPGGDPTSSCTPCPQRPGGFEADPSSRPGRAQLGPVIPGVASTFENPGGGRSLAAYSLGHGEVESWTSLPASGEER